MDAGQYLSSLPQIIQDLTTSNRSQVAATAWLWYDWFICLEDEIELIWKQKWSLAKFLYIISRYYGMFCSLYFAIGDTQRTMPDRLCAMWDQFFGGSAIVLAASCDLILILRLYALYGKKTRVLAALATLLCSELIVEAVIIGLVTHNESAVPKPSILTVDGCLTTDTFGSLDLVAWVPALATNTIYFFLMLYKLHPYIRTLGPRGSKTRLLTVFVRDGSIFYAIVFAAVLVNALIPPLVGRNTRVGLEEVGLPWVVAAFSFSGSRLTLNLRAAAVKESLPINEKAHLSAASPTSASRGGGGGYRKAVIPLPPRSASLASKDRKSQESASSGFTRWSRDAYGNRWSHDAFGEASGSSSGGGGGGTLPPVYETDEEPSTASSSRTGRVPTPAVAKFREMLEGEEEAVLDISPVSSFANPTSLGPSSPAASPHVEASRIARPAGPVPWLPQKPSAAHTKSTARSSRKGSLPSYAAHGSDPVLELGVMRTSSGESGKSGKSGKSGGSAHSLDGRCWCGGDCARENA